MDSALRILGYYHESVYSLVFSMVIIDSKKNTEILNSGSTHQCLDDTGGKTFQQESLFQVLINLTFSAQTSRWGHHCRKT
jgi:hypothetical protein